MTAISYSGMKEEVREQIAQLQFLCRCWRETEMSHDQFMIGTLAVQRKFQGIPTKIWDHSEETGRQLVEEYNEATEEALRIYSAIKALRHKGYTDNAPVPEKKLQFPDASKHGSIREEPKEPPSP